MNPLGFDGRDKRIAELEQELHLSKCDASSLRALLAERGEEIANLWDVLARIDKTLRVPAAEYVPAIGDVFKIIDTELVRALKAAAVKSREAPDAD